MLASTHVRCPELLRARRGSINDRVISGTLPEHAQAGGGCMGTSGRLGGDDIDNPDIRDGSIDNPDIRDPTVGNPDIRTGVDNPDIRDPTVGNPDIRTGVDNPDIRDASVDNPDLAPQSNVSAGHVRPPSPPAPGGVAMSGGLPLVPMAIVGGLVVVAIAAFSFLGGGGAPGSTTGATVGPGVTSGLGSTTGAGATTGTGAGPAAEETANLVVTGADVSGSWTLDASSGDLSPTATLIAGVWVETVDNVAEGYGDLVTLSLGGTIVEGTQATSEAGLGLGFTINRIDASGNDLFNHVFSSKAGECHVTMERTATGVSGTFNCASITDADGHTVSASGSFAT
jgi:hypothetical protein